jgi:hypothetical protein
MPLQKNPNAPLRQITSLAECMRKTQVASQPAKKDFDPVAYRDQFAQALVDMKQASRDVFESGHTAGIAQIGEIAILLEVMAEAQRPKIADEIFWDQLSQHYPVRGSWVIKLSNLPTALQLRLLEQMVTQEREPQVLIRRQLERMTNEAFMDGFTLALRMMHPSEIQYQPDFYEPLYSLKQRVADPSLMPDIVEHIVAHQELYMEYLERVTRVAKVWDDHGRLDGESDEALVFRRRQMVMRAMGYDEIEMQAMFDSGQAVNVVPNFEIFQLMRNALALPAEFLHMLHQATGSPLLLEMAEFSLLSPTGRTPYAFLEQMGLAQTPEWHLNAQEFSDISIVMRLYEHAIHTPGLEVSADRLTWHTPRNQDWVERIVEVLMNVPVKDPECRRKGQQIFDALVKNMEAGKNVDKLKNVIENGQIPAALYKNHPALKGKKLENELGM